MSDSSPDDVVPNEEILPPVDEASDPHERITGPPEPSDTIPDERESMVTVLTNLLSEHEEREKVDRDQLRSELEALARTVDNVFDENLGLPALRQLLVQDFKEAAREIANPFLAKAQEWIDELRGVKETQATQQKKIEDLERLRGQVTRMERELKRVREQVDILLRAQGLASD